MDTNNILSYLAVGRPTDRLIGGASGEGTDQSLAERVALGQAASFVENLAASRLGLDVVRIEPTPEGTIFLTAGQYLSPQFYVAIQQSITDEPGAQVTSRVPDITLEYELTRWLLMRALYRNPNLRLNLFWEYAY
jgi:translocation and assembly module TamB